MWPSFAIAVLLSGIDFQSPAVRSMQADEFANPGLLWVDRGAALWNEGCSSCHGDVSSMKGVSTRYPAWSPPLARVVDLEERINACVTAKARRPALAWESQELLGLTALIARQSRGIPIEGSVAPQAAALHERGRTLYFERQGQLNLACTQCHDDNWGKKLLAEPISQGHPADWPAYRLEWQTLGSLQRRLRACYYGVRAEMPAFGSDDLRALELYLAHRAKGLATSVPGVRR